MNVLRPNPAVNRNANGGHAVTLVTVAHDDYGVYAAPPALAQAGALGITITYTLAVTSLGDLADSFNIAVTGQAWTTLAPATVGPLPSLKRQ